MSKRKLILIPAVLSLVFSACNNGDKRTDAGLGIGAALGGITGAIIGHQTGNEAAGALIGAGVGGAVGGTIGHKLDQQAKELQQVAETKRTDDGIVTTLKNNILFQSGSYALAPAATDAVAQISTIIKKYPEDHIVVVGYTDDTGSENSNQVLSEKRANAVRTYMITDGIASNSMEAVGMGESSPVVPNINEENRAKNRRVELKITMPEGKKQ